MTVDGLVWRDIDADILCQHEKARVDIFRWLVTLFPILINQVPGWGNVLVGDGVFAILRSSIRWSSEAAGDLLFFSLHLVLV